MENRSFPICISNALLTHDVSTSGFLLLSSQQTQKNMSFDAQPLCDDLSSSDALLTHDISKFRVAASRTKLESVALALTANGHTVEVVSDKSAALEAAKAKLSPDKTVMFAGSGTLSEIGLTGFLKENAGAVKQNFKADSLVAMRAGDMAAAGAATEAGKTADIHFSSVDAITEDGTFTVCDATGSRTCGFLSAKSVVVVAGANKIVADLAAAQARQTEHMLPCESARARVAFASWGVQSSTIANVVTIKNKNPWGGPRFHFILMESVAGF